MTPTFDDQYRQWRQEHDTVANMNKLFVLGCAKSGTTWLMNLLNGHPQIVIRGEGAFTYQLMPALAQAFNAFNQHQRGKDPITHLRDVDLAMTARTMIDSQFARYVAESGKNQNEVRVVGDKTPQHTISLTELNRLYPQAKFLNIIRDPRDVATSAWFHFGKNDRRPFEDFIRYYITQVWPINVGGARKVAPQLGNRYREVRYEDLHTDEEVQIKDMLQFLDVEASDAAMQTCLNAGDFQRRSGGRQRGQTDETNFYRSGTTGDWRNHLPPELVEDCCKAIAPLMTACGYESACAQAVA